MTVAFEGSDSELDQIDEARLVQAVVIKVMNRWQGRAHSSNRVLKILLGVREQCFSKEDRRSLSAELLADVNNTQVVVPRVVDLAVPFETTCPNEVDLNRRRSE